jgi:ATP-binding cassette subfamily B protein
MILSSLAEFFSISAIMPFLGVLIAPEKVYNLPQLSFLFDFLGIKSSSEILIPIILMFGFLVLIANCMRMLVVWAGIRLSSSLGADLSLNIYCRTLYQPYLVHISRSSSEVINVVTNQVNYAVLTITMVINLVSSAIMLASITLAIILIDPLMASIAFGGFGLIYLLVIQLMSVQVKNAGQQIATESTRVIKVLQEGLGGIRDILLDGTQATYLSIFHRADTRARRAQGNIEIISFSPRYGVETIALLFILGIAYFLTANEAGIGGSIPILGALALGAQRMLPILQLAYVSITGIRGNKYTLKATLDMLDQPLPPSFSTHAKEGLTFNSELRLFDLAFKYSPQSNWILKNLNLTIPKGSRIGFIGKTGSGKSTLLDLIMGLLEPTEGLIKVDGIVINDTNRMLWQRRIAHVPQSIYLSDNSIEENIAFGIPKQEIDFELLKRCAAQAHIADLIEGWPLQYQTHVGERGVRLSGGQRQRIGIARALYKKADVIIFDEATSALDNETEEAVIKAIEGLGNNLTILIIAHRLTTLRGCTQVVELDQGSISKIGSYQDIILEASQNRIEGNNASK